MIILPAIDIKDGNCVRLVRGDYGTAHKVAEDYMQTARSFAQAGAAWIHMVDLDGAKDAKPVNTEIFLDVAKNTPLKVEVGGGIRTMETCARLFEAGASRLVLGTALVRDPEFAQAAIAKYGDTLAAGIDAKAGEAAVAGWREGSGVAATDLARSMSELGYCHLVYTDIARDGMQTGIDPAAYDEMAQAFGHPVIASGGVASLDDIERLAPIADRIEGVITGRAIYEGTLPLREAIERCKM